MEEKTYTNIVYGDLVLVENASVTRRTATWYMILFRFFMKKIIHLYYVTKKGGDSLGISMFWEPLKDLAKLSASKGIFMGSTTSINMYTKKIQRSWLQYVRSFVLLETYKWRTKTDLSQGKHDILEHVT